MFFLFILPVVSSQNPHLEQMVVSTDFEEDFAVEDFEDFEDFEEDFDFDFDFDFSSSS